MEPIWSPVVATGRNQRQIDCAGDLGRVIVTQVVADLGLPALSVRRWYSTAFGALDFNTHV
jgi:hypothetical protein